MTGHTQNRLITEINVREYFQHSVAQAVANQNLRTTEETQFYLVNLLTDFSDSRTLYKKTGEGFGLEPLASLYAEALELSAKDARNRVLKRLGDIALFIAGVFSDSLNRKAVDIDYYIAMGGNAYAYLSDVMRGTFHAKGYADVFGELSEKFVGFVDVLGEVGESAHLTSGSDILRLYEVWLRTHSKRAARRLRTLGIHPVDPASADRRH